MEAFGMKKLLGLQKENLKNKLWMIAAVWYLLGMICLLFSAKLTIPEGEARSLYVGPGNTSFFAMMVLLGILMGAGSFSYLHWEEQTDLYLSLPFSRSQLFWVEYGNQLLIFVLPAVVCKLLFFRISLSMGYCRYEESVSCVWMSCVILILGFLLIMNLSMLASLLTLKGAGMTGLLALFLWGPDAGLGLAEKMLAMFVPSFYQAQTIATLKEYLSPFSLLKNVTGIEAYMDGPYWRIAGRESYLFYLAVLVIVLTLINWFCFQRRPVERKVGIFAFPIAGTLVRYGCVALSVLWLVDLLQVFSFGAFSLAGVIAGLVLGLPLTHGLLNMVLAWNAKKFLSGGKSLLVEGIMMICILLGFSFWGKLEGKIPGKEELSSMAVCLTALESGDGEEEILQNMELTGEELSTAYDWVNGDYGEETSDYQVIVKYVKKNGGKRYRRYALPWYGLDEFGQVFDGEQFKEGAYKGLRLDSMKYYEIRWSNGVESYRLDLNEEERRGVWEAYKRDFAKLSFSELKEQTPVGVITFASVKNQGDVRVYLYPGYTGVLTLLKEYGIDGTKRIQDYEITKIIGEKYVLTEGLLYQVDSLEWRKEITDKTTVRKLAETLFWEELCKDDLLNGKNGQMEFTVYYRDSQGRTVDQVKCRAQAAPQGNEVLKELLKQ